MKNIDLSKFHLVEPTPNRITCLAFSVMADGTLRMNGKLQLQFKKSHVCIFTDDTGKQILLQEVTNEQTCARLVPKSGTVRAVELLPILKNNKTAIPARYHVEWNEGVQMWLGEVDTSYVFKIPKTSEKKLKTSRKNGLENMIPGVK